MYIYTSIPRVGCRRSIKNSNLYPLGCTRAVGGPCKGSLGHLIDIYTGSLEPTPASSSTAKTAQAFNSKLVHPKTTTRKLLSLSLRLSLSLTHSLSLSVSLSLSLSLTHSLTHSLSLSLSLSLALSRSHSLTYLLTHSLCVHTYAMNIPLFSFSLPFPNSPYSPKP